MTAYRYLAYKRRNEHWYSGHKLLTIEQIHGLKDDLIEMNHEVFETIQTYDDIGNAVHSPLYADFDGEGCIEDVVKVCNVFKSEFDVMPDIYLSGNKGFHIIYPITIPHPRPHLISKKFFSIIAKDSKFLDQKVYTNRRLFRCEGSIHHKTGRYKTAIQYEELIKGMDYINNIANKRSIGRIKQADRNSDKLLRFLLTVFKMVENEHNQKDYTIKDNIELNADMPKCIATMIATPPNDGDWNESIMLLARWFNSVGYEREDAIEEMLHHEHWVDDFAHVKKVFNSVFRDVSIFGCRNISLLESNCNPYCRYSAGVKTMPFKENNHGSNNSIKRISE